MQIVSGNNEGWSGNKQLEWSAEVGMQWLKLCAGVGIRSKNDLLKSLIILINQADWFILCIYWSTWFNLIEI